MDSRFSINIYPYVPRYFARIVFHECDFCTIVLYFLDIHCYLNFKVNIRSRGPFRRYVQDAPRPKCNELADVTKCLVYAFQKYR